MEYQDLAQASAVAGALGAPLLLLARGRVILLAGLAVLLVAEAGLAYALVPDAPERVGASPLRLGLVAVLGLVGLTLAGALVRFPAATPVVLLVAAPFRVSVGLGSDEASLLLPLYAALAAATAAFAYRTLRGDQVTAVPLLVAVPASVLVGLAGVSLLWAHDRRAGTIELVFFYFPFAALLGLVARTRPAPWTGRALTSALLSLTAVFAAIGVYQAWTRVPLVAKHDVQLANARASYFRVTSVFEDPSVYGRHLVLGIAVVLALLWVQRIRPAAGLPLLLLLAAGLYVSYSQTSLLALFASVLAISLAAGDRHARLVFTGTAVCLALAGSALVVATADGQSAGRFTSDRLPLARLTLPVYAEHPVAGVGIGSQPLVSRQEQGGRREKSQNVSHTTPLTVAAELGTLGLLAYAAFLLGAARTLVLAWARDRALALALVGCLTALVVHSLSYGSFFEDPFVWGVAGLAAAAVAFLPRGATDQPRPGARRFTARARPVPAQGPGSTGR